MFKYSILCHHLEYGEFLDKLYELGVVHILEKDKEEVDNYKKHKLNLQIYAKSLQKIAQERKITEPIKGELDKDKDILGFVQDMEEKIDELEKQKSNLQKEVDNYAIWGNFDRANIGKLKNLGITARFFQCSASKFQPEWLEEHPIEVINEDKSRIYFIYLQQGNGKIDLPVAEVEIPDEPLSQIELDIQGLEKQIAQTNKDIDENVAIALGQLGEQAEMENKELDYRYANSNSVKLSDDKIILLEGWVPESKKENLDQYLEKQAMVYFAEAPEKEDKIPILLKNSNFNKLFEPIGKLFSLPAYQEIDLTPFFAPFFMLFFGFCVGDTGYGLLILIGTLILRGKVKKEMKPMLTLASFLGAATIIMGLISGTFFGINLAETQSYPLKQIILDPLKLFWLSIGIGGLQTLYGLVIKASNQIKQNSLKYGLSTLGWVFLIVFGGMMVGLPKLGIQGNLVATILKGGMVLSGALILLFANPEKNMLVSALSGLYDVYNMITGIFGDLLSYIRLFALGISSAILGLVFNQIAAQFLGMGIVGWVLFIIVLLIGHGLNIFLACLGAFVHPLRLTFVEFYKNAGFTGGGKQYEPFKKTKI